jgi:hypothetical protein
MMHVADKMIRHSLFALFLLIVGCAVNPDRTWLIYANGAVDRKDWPAAYRLMEDTLVSDDPGIRKEAMNLVEKYPQIRQGAYETFSVDSLEMTYIVHGKRAWSIENDRLSIYQKTIATPEQYKQAIHNYQEVFGTRIAESQGVGAESHVTKVLRASQEKEYQHELQEVVHAKPPGLNGETRHLLESLKRGQTSRRQALALLGKPSRRFEANTILTWPVRVNEDKYSILPSFERNQEGVTDSLILIFDHDAVLDQASLVRIVK